MGKGGNNPAALAVIARLDEQAEPASILAFQKPVSPPEGPGGLEAMGNEWRGGDGDRLRQNIDALAESKRRSEKQQKRRRDEAGRILKEIDSGAADTEQLIHQFLKSDNIEPCTDAEQRAAQRKAMLSRPSAWERAIEFRRQKLNQVESFIASKAASLVAPDSGIAQLEFIETFIKSRAFRAHLTNVMAEELYRLEDDAPGGKDSENAVREAATRVIDAEELATSTGYWVDEQGREYYVEVMREHSATALFDLVLDVTDMESGERFQSCLQFKSYKQTHIIPEGESPEAGYVKPPAGGTYKIAVANSSKSRMDGNPQLISEEARVRVLATDTYLSVEPTVQHWEGQKVPLMVTNNTVATHPAVHQAIAKCSNLPELFKPVRKKGQTKKDGTKMPDYYLLQAAVEVNAPDQPTQLVVLTHGTKLQANKSGVAKTKDGSYKTISGGSSGIYMEVPEGLMVPFFLESFFSRPVAEDLVSQQV